MSIIFSRANPIGLIVIMTIEYQKDIEDIRADDITAPYRLRPFLEATMEVTSSGRLVPMAMIVSPISVWLSPRLDAIEMPRQRRNHRHI